MRGTRFRWACAALLAAAPLGVPASVAGAERERLDVRLFARVPSPGAPEGVAVGPDGKIYTASLNAEGNGDPNAPSRVFAYSPAGKLLRSYRISGQTLAENHGLTGLAFDGEGRLYVGDLSPPRVLRLDTRTGRQTTYATLRDVPACGGGVNGDCSPGSRDFHAWPDYLAFTPNGSLYVTDSLQARIWRIPKGGGKGRVFFSDPRLATEIGPPAFGPSAMTLMPDRRTLMFTVVAQPAGSTVNAAAGRIYKLAVRSGDTPGSLQSFWESETLDAPGGIAFGRSGKVYVALSGSNQMAVFSAQGQELERAPSPVENLALQPPMDSPLAVAFEGRRLIVANNSFLTHDPNAWALLDVYAGEEGVPMVRPRIGPSCIPPSGRIAGRRLGPARLGWTRRRIRRVLGPRSSRRNIDRFCLGGGGALRVGYPSRSLLRRLGAAQRGRVRGRAVLLLTSSRRYNLRRVRAGSSLRRLRARVRGLRGLRLGRNTWYSARGRRSRLLFKVRRGRVREVGLANTRLTASRRGAKRFLLSFR